MPQSNLVKPQRQQSIGAAIRNNPINLVKLLAVVITWPATLPIYGPVALCAANFQVTAVTKFSTSFWNVISLNFLRFVEDPPKEESRISEGEKEPPPAAPEPPSNPAVKIPELPLIHPQNEQLADTAYTEAVKAMCDQAVALGLGLSVNKFLRYASQNGLNALEIYEFCKSHYPDLGARIDTYTELRDGYCRAIRGLRMLLRGDLPLNEALMDIAHYPIKDVIIICKHIEKFYPKLIKGVNAGIKEILYEQWSHGTTSGYDEWEKKMFNTATRIPDADPADMARECVGEGGKLDTAAISALKLGPDAYCVKVWRELKKMGFTIDRLLLERDSNERFIRHIFCGMSLEDLAVELQDVSDENILYMLNRWSCDPHLIAKILAAIPRERRLAIVDSSGIDLGNLEVACETIRKLYPELAAETFPSDAAEICGLHPDSNRTLVCTMNVPSAPEAAELAYTIYGSKFMEKLRLMIDVREGAYSIATFTKFAAICRELMISGLATYDNMHNYLFYGTGIPVPSRVRLAIDSTLIRQLVKYGQISPSIFAQFLREVPQDKRDNYLHAFDYEYMIAVERLLSNAKS